jgi:hypothetical protein
LLNGEAPISSLILSEINCQLYRYSFTNENPFQIPIGLCEPMNASTLQICTSLNIFITTDIKLFQGFPNGFGKVNDAHTADIIFSFFPSSVPRLIVLMGIYALERYLHPKSPIKLYSMSKMGYEAIDTLSSPIWHCRNSLVLSL